jgi:hypothetical protein
VIDDDYNLPMCKYAVDDYRRTHGIKEELMPMDDAAVYWRRSGTVDEPGIDRAPVPANARLKRRRSCGRHRPQFSNSRSESVEDSLEVDRREQRSRGVAFRRRRRPDRPVQIERRVVPGDRQVLTRLVGPRVQVADVGDFGDDLEAVGDKRREVEWYEIDVVEFDALDVTERR